MGPPANIYAHDTHAIKPVLVNNWGNSDNASVESNLLQSFRTEIEWPVTMMSRS
jgi:hypothetical protein